MPETEPSALVKAQFFGAGRDGSEFSNVLETPDEQTTLFNKAGAIQPPLDPVSLANLFEMSGALRSNVDAYAVNIDSFGYTLEPVIDPDADDAPEKIKLAITQERMLETKAPVSDEDVEKLLAKMIRDGEHVDPIDDPGEVPEPTPEEVAERMRSIRREMVRERIAAERFFGFVALEESFEKLRMKMRQDLEITGNAYWEVLRNVAGEIVQFDYVPGYSIRLMPQERNPQRVMMEVRATVITPRKEPAQKRFRKYVQVANGAVRGSNLVWFKEFGDPRVYSSRSGKEYKSAEALNRKEPGVRPATELIHFKIHNSRSVYGLPRWVSEMLAVIGTRHADEVNLAYFENKSVPPMAILVSGGRLVKEDVTRLENYVKNEIRGKRNFHKIMLLEAESTEGGMPGMSTGRTRIEIKPLTDAQTNDAQFMRYKEANTDAIGSVFRLPRLLRGDARDFNRATAQTSLEFTEQQVFAPLRKSFDYFINRCLLPALGINFWTFRSKGPDFSDPTKMLDAINGAATASYLTPEELRGLASRAFGVEFPKLDQDWVTRPIQLTLGGITTGQTNPSDASASRESSNVQPNAGNEPSETPADKGEVIELAAGRFRVLDPEDEADRLMQVMKVFARKETEAAQEDA
jgi:PBSX family phage portal protein